jgi:hypothetical protein
MSLMADVAESGRAATRFTRTLHLKSGKQSEKHCEY